MTPRRRAGTGWPPIRGTPDAQYNLGLMYASGEGVPEDDAEAAGRTNRHGDPLRLGYRLVQQSCTRPTAGVAGR